MTAIRTRVAFYIYCAVVALAPLPFGSVDNAVIAFWVILLSVVVILTVPLRAKLSRPHLIFLFLALMVAVAWAVVFHEQASLQPWLAKDLIDPIWRQTSDLLGVQLPQSVTVVRNQPYFAAGAQMAAFLSLIGGFLVGSRQVFARYLLRVVAWSGTFYAIYGIASFIWDPKMLLWREKIAYETVLTGTFVNRNTAAIYFGVCAILWLLLFFRRLFGPSLRMPAEMQLSAWLLRDLPKNATLYLGMFMLLLSATFMTGSRAGSILISLACAAVCITCLQKRGSSRKALLSLAAGIMLAGTVVLAIMGGGVDARIGSLGLTDPARLSVYRAVIRMILDRPWLGTGLGTFAWIFPSYRPSDITVWGIWDRAHNTLLEIAAEQGVPFAVAVVSAFTAILLTLIFGVRSRKSGRIYPFLALLVAIISSAHSLIDFSLQIPGFAIVAFAIIGTGLAQSLLPREVVTIRDIALSDSKT